MKRLLAMLLAGCMLVQTLPGSAVTALGAEEIAVLSEGDFAADGSAEDMTAPDAEGNPEKFIEEIPPDDLEIIPSVPGGNTSAQNTGGGVTADTENADGSPGDEIIDEINVISSDEMNISGNGADMLIESEAGKVSEDEGDSALEYAEISQDPGLTEDIVYDAISSYIEVRVAAGQSFVPDGGLVVEAGYSRPDGTDAHTEQKTLANLGDTAVFEFKVDPGEYKVTVDADRYACYEQTITTKASQRSRICVSTAKSVKKNESDAGSGWLRLGDVKGDGETDEDGKIDDTDINTICDVILERNISPADRNAANLNAGLEDVEKVDIADLQIAVQNRKEEEQISSVEVQQIPRPPKAEAGTKIKGDGNLNDLISSSEENKKPVTLQPEAGTEITAENPVAISFPLAAEGEEAPQLEGMTLKAFAGSESTEESGGSKTDNGIKSGWLEVESADENGKPVIYLVKMTDDTEMNEALKTPSAEETEAETETETQEEIKQVLNEMNEEVAGMPGESGAEADTMLIENESQGTSEESETNTEADSALAESETDTETAPAFTESGAQTEADTESETRTEADTTLMEVQMDDVFVGTEKQQTETAAGTETNVDLAGDLPGMDAGTIEAPISINMEDVVLGDPVKEALDGTNSETDPNVLSINLEDRESVSFSMDGAVPYGEDVIVIPDEIVPQADTIPVRREVLEESSASVANDGSIVMNFGKQIAVKKVTIKITGTTKKEENLVNISKVEFVNDMASRIPEPELSIPELKLAPGNEEILVTWEEQPNVTGYELEITGIAKKQTTEQTQTVCVAGTEHTFTHINNNDLRNFRPYKIRVRSINGEWRSKWSDIQEATPKPDARPEPVDNLKIKAGYRSLSLNWKDMDDASGYMVFYREESETEFRPVVEGSGTYQPESNTEAEVNKSGEGRITTNSYTLSELEDGKLYYVYVIGWNELGWGTYKNDRIVSERTDSKARPQLPKYHAINLPETDDESTVGVLTPHIDSASCREYDANPNNNSEEKDKGKQPRMVNSKLDGCAAEEGDTTPKKTNSALGVVDNDYNSYWQKYDWDEGISYNRQGGITVKLDKAYEMSYLTYSAYNIDREFANNYMGKVRILYRDTTTNADAEEQEVLAYISQRRDINNQLYYLIKFQEAVTANEIRICFGSAYGDIWMRVGEIRFHECDDWYDGIMNLFADDMHSALRSEPEVTEEELARLETGLETPDEHGEKHPLYDSLKLELELAKKMFADRNKDQTVLKVDTRLTTNSDGHLKFGGLNAWQPLGRVATAGETMVIYVGHNTKRAEESSNVQVVFTQYHAQSNQLNSTVNLKVGRNEVLVPRLTNEGREQGGQVYIQYTGSRGSAEKYEVRVLGGQKIPALNIYKMEPGAEKTAAIEKYVKELDEYVKTIRETHESLRPTENTPANEAWKKNSNLGLDYTDRNCFLNATDLMMDYMMYSVPALQVWNGITNGADVSKSLSDAEVTEAAKKLETSLNAMEDTMRLFYQHKGLSDDPKAVSSEERGSNEMPVKHLNIRYMQMFAGAFMYASGNHIGVEYPETNVAGGAASWDSFGWGIGHEIGHDINQSWYAIAEITNNYFAQLLTKAYNGTRFKYEIAPGGEDDPANDIYSKVTSGTLGRSANGAVQLGLYWQLHLAFDNYTINNQKTNHTLNDTTTKVLNGEYKTNTDDRYVFDNYEDQFNNLFFARVDTYGRNPSKAPNGGVTLASGAAAVDQNLMRLSCAAANANILPFFERWGMVPDEGTLAYAATFGAATEKALYYVNDDARDYRAAHPGEPDNILNKDAIESAVTKADGNKVSITVTPKTSVNGEALLGYEIIRTMYSNGRPEEAVVGFKLANGSNPVTYIDEIATINNRVMYYKVKAVDKYLNYSNAVDAGSEKIETNGALPKSEWTIETTMTSADDVTLNPSPSFDKMPAPYVDNGKDDPDGGFDSDLRRVQSNAKKVEHSIDKIADGSDSSAYTGTNGTNAIITIDMHDFCKVTSLIYRGDDLGTVIVSVSTDNTNWTDVKNIDMAGINANADGSRTIWFDAASDDPEVRAAWIGTYKARYVKLAFSKAGAVQIKEIDICGPSGDNLEFERAGEGPTAGQAVIGVLKEAYTYSYGEDKIEGTDDDDIIPKGSLVFTGRYKGNPAYNVVILYDAEGNVIGAHKTADGEDEVQAEQIIFAEVPKNGNLGETSDGIWVYYLEPEIWENEETWKSTVKGNKIRGELYRVDNALTNEGERIVSDTKFITLDDTLPEITMTGGGLDAAPAGEETETETRSGDTASTEQATEGGME